MSVPWWKNPYGPPLEVVGAEAGSVLLATPETKQLVFSCSVGTNPVNPGTTIPWDQGIAGTVFQSGEPEFISDVKTDPRHYPDIDAFTSYRTRDLIAIPLKKWEGQPVGVMEVMNKHEGRLDEDDIAILTIISAFTAISIEEARLFQEAKLAEVARFFGDIGHDIKNMLMPVLSGSWLLQDELNGHFHRVSSLSGDQVNATQDVTKELIEMIRNNARRIQDRVRELADAIKGVTSSPQFGPCQVSKVVEDVIATLRVYANERGVTLETKDLDSLPLIQADERRLFNALYNLINNAIAEVPAGGSVTVYGRSDPAGKTVELSVSDTGRGMAPEVRDSLFTANAISRKAGGTGLGTKIVKDVIDAHAGSIKVESEVGVGTTFRITLPIERPDSSERL